MSREGALWIGGLETYMDEEFLMKCLNTMGEHSILSIKVIKNKFTGGAAGYGFINFVSDQVALTCMHKLNGKMMPNTSPPVRFKLNHNSNRLLPGEKNNSVWVGDLSPDVDDLQLYRFFSARFQSIVSAKVVLDDSGGSKGFGFIRFGNEQEQQTALTSMMGIAGLGSKPIKVSIAVQKPKASKGEHEMEIPQHLAQQVAQGVIGGKAHTQPPAQDYQASAGYYQHYNSQYWSQYAAWQQWQQQYAAWEQQQQQAAPAPAQASNAPSSAPSSAPPPPERVRNPDPHSWTEGPLNQLIPHTRETKLAETNNKYLQQSEEIWTSLEESFWSKPDVK